MDGMKGYANAGLLVTPRRTCRMVDQTTATPRPLVLDLRPPDAYAAGHIPGAVHLDLWGVSLIDTDPAPLKAFMWMIEHVLRDPRRRRRRRRSSSTTSSRACAPRARSGFSSTSAIRRVRLLDGGFSAWTRGRAAGHARRRRRRRRASGPARATTQTLATWRDVRDALGQPRRGHPRHAQRRRVLRHHRARDARRRDSRRRAHRVDAQPRRPTATFKPAAELRTMYEDAGVTPDREVITYCQGGYRAAHSYWRCGCSAIRACATTSARGRNGATATDLPDRNPSRTDRN